MKFLLKVKKVVCETGMPGFNGPEPRNTKS